MKDEMVTAHNVHIICELLQEEVIKNKVVIVNSQTAGTGKWGMTRLWRAWMAPTAKFMAENGAKMPLMIKKDGAWYGSRPFNVSDAHELFTRQWLGVDDKGERLSWAKSGKKRVATKGERFDALRKHENWCIEKGIILFKPRESEYSKLEDQQNT